MTLHTFFTFRTKNLNISCSTRPRSRSYPPSEMHLRRSRQVARGRRPSPEGGASGSRVAEIRLRRRRQVARRATRGAPKGPQGVERCPGRGACLRPYGLQAPSRLYPERSEPRSGLKRVAVTRLSTSTND